MEDEPEKSPQDTSHHLQHKAILTEFEARGAVSGTRATIKPKSNSDIDCTDFTCHTQSIIDETWTHRRAQSLQVYNTQHSKIIRHAETLTYHLQTAKSQK